MKRKQNEMASRGMSLVFFEKNTTEPHFINIDDDPFRTKRTMWIFAEGDTTIGKSRDSKIRPFDFNVKPNHCVMRRSGDALKLIGGEGAIFVNGIKCQSSDKLSKKTVAEQVLQPYDRIVLGGSLFLFVHPGHNPSRPEPTADEITDEYRSAEQDVNDEMAAFASKLMEAQKVGVSSKVGSEGDLEKEKIRSQKRKVAMDAVNFEARQMFPKVNEANDLCHSLDRDALTFSVKLQQTALDALVPTVKVQVLNNETSQTIMIDTFEFLRGYSSLKDEYREITTALDTGRVYSADPENDPVHQFFNNTYHCGTVYCFPEYLLFGFQTDESENEHIMEIKAVDDPAVTIGKMEMTWTPLTADDEVKEDDPYDIIEDPAMLLGKTWKYQLAIKQVMGLPFTVCQARVQYTFYDELFSTDTCNKVTVSPSFGDDDDDTAYRSIHEVPVVDQDFIDFLQKPLEFMLHVAPYVERQQDEGPISTENPTIVQRIRHPTQVDDEERADNALPPLPPDASSELKNAFHAMEKRLREVNDREARMAKLEAEFRTKERKFREMQSGASAAGTVPSDGGCCTVS
jgi:hypothetical protein